MELQHVFGFRGNLRNNVIYIDDTTVAHPCGNLVVICNLETKAQRFIFGSDKCRGICAIACPASKKVIAVAEYGAQSVIVTIYDATTLKKRKVFTCSDMKSEALVDISFSADGKQLLAFGGDPDWTLMIWSWEKNKCLCTTKISNMQGNALKRADFLPSDPSCIMVYGEGFLKFLRIQDGSVRNLPMTYKKDLQNYVCHTWLTDDRLVLATSRKDLLFFEGLEYRTFLPFVRSDGDDLDNEDPLLRFEIDSLMSYSKGFVCGGSGNTVCLFEQSDDPHEYYRHSKTFRVKGQMSRITNLAVSPSEDILACSLDNNHVYLLGLSNSDILKEEDLNFDIMTTSVHGPFVPEGKKTQANGGAFDVLDCRVTGLDTCVRKPLVATCGTDRTIRIWNYLDKNLVLMKSFAEIPVSLAFHPSGLHLLVGFSDKLRLLNVLMDDIRPFKEFALKGSRVVTFSNGGQLFAAANGNIIQVFQTYTFECVHTLRGHASRVQAITWTDKDRALVSVGAGGAVYRWSTLNGLKTHEFNTPGHALKSVTSADDCGLLAICAGNSDGKILQVLLSSEPHVQVELGGQGVNSFEQLTVLGSQCALFASVADQQGGSREPIGTAVRLSLPLTLNSPKEAQNVSRTGTEIDSPASSPCSSSVSSIHSEDEEVGNSALRKDSKEIQLTNVKVDFEKLRRLRIHQGRITEMRRSHDDRYLFTAGEDGVIAIYAIHEEGAARKGRDRESPIPFAEEILVARKDLEEKAALMKELKEKVDELTLHNEYQLRLKDLNYSERINELNNKFEEELAQDVRKYEKLESDKKKMEDMGEERIAKLKQQHRQNIEAIEESYQEKIDSEALRYERLVNERELMESEWVEHKKRFVASHEALINDMTKDYEDKLAQELKEREEIDATKESRKAEFETRKHAVEEDADLEIEELKHKYDEKLTFEHEATLRLKGENGIMKKKFSALQKDIEEQKNKIKQLMNREVDLYGRIKSLQKDIAGHKKEIKEREETIRDKEKRIYDLKKKNQELEKFKFVLDYKIKELKRQIDPREKEITEMRHQIKEMDMELAQYQKSNGALDLMIGELRLKIDGMQREIDAQNEKLKEGKLAADQCKIDLQEAAKVLNDHQVLKQRIIQMNRLYSEEAMSLAKEKKNDKKNEENGAIKAVNNVQREYNRQREYLEKSVESLKRKLSKDLKTHQADKMRLLRESVDLTNEINTLRRELHSVKEHHSSASVSNKTKRNMPQNQASEVTREVKLQQEQISNLQQKIAHLEAQLGLCKQ